METWNEQLVKAAKYGDMGTLKLCLQNYADLEFRDRFGLTPLMESALNGHLEITKLLLDRKCNKTTTDRVGWTALMLAAGGGHLEITKLLLDRKCNKNTTDNDGRTILHLAAQYGHLRLTRYLVDEVGISPFVTTHKGKTPYDLAKAGKIRKTRQVVEYLHALRSRSHHSTTSCLPKSAFIWTKLVQLKRDDFMDLVALGTFASYENRVYLAGPCNIGKSSLASILIGDAIPKKWFSTDGLIIHFGRNDIDLQNRKMIPLKKGSGDVLTKLLLGNPVIKTQQRLPGSSKIKQTRNTGEVTKIQRSNPTEPKRINPLNMDKFSSDKQQSKPNANSGQTHSFEQEYSNQPDLGSLKGFQEPPIHTPYSIQDDLLKKIKDGSYTMNIAPSDLVDFGGQKSFDMTHQLFIQHRGTFILMFDGRFGLHTRLKEYPHGDVTAASILEHWINSVLTYCNKTEDNMPRIVFAATHSDRFSEKEKREQARHFEKELQTMFFSHKLKEHIMYDRVFFINATDIADLDIDGLKNRLVDIAWQQSTWGQQMPIIWVPLDLQISDMRSNGVKMVTKEKLLEINKSNKECALKESRVEDFLLVQHSIGKLLYFNEPALSDFIVIEPTAMVNILRAFITDKLFWPENGPIRDILVKLSSTGVLKKTELFILWSQPTFKDILTDVRTKEYVVQVLLHLDILVEPKRYTQKDIAADSFLVPCIVKCKIPPEMQEAATDDRSICIAYHLKETVVPSALSFKLIGASISIWPLKVVDSRLCLYFQAAIMDVDNRNELQIYVDGQKIIVYLINEVSKHHISPDVATTIQECLTLALGRILQFYSHCVGNQSGKAMSDLFEIEVGDVCNGDTCLIPLSDAKKQKSWSCKHGKKHETKCPLNWVFDKNKEDCDANCEGLEKEAKVLLLKPNDQHFVHLAKKLGIRDFYDFFFLLGMTKTDYENLNFRYFSNPMDMMLMGMIQWRNKTESDQSPATFGKLLEALNNLQAIDSRHYLCQIHREDHGLVEKAHSRLQVVPADEVINALTEKNMIGDCAVHLGIELGLSIEDIKKTMHNFPRDLDGQIHDLLIKWKKTNRVKPTIYWLMVALKRVEAAKGLDFLQKTYDVE